MDNDDYTRRITITVQLKHDNDHFLFDQLVDDIQQLCDEQYPQLVVESWS